MGVQGQQRLVKLEMGVQGQQKVVKLKRIKDVGLVGYLMNRVG